MKGAKGVSGSPDQRKEDYPDRLRKTGVYDLEAFEQYCN